MDDLDFIEKRLTYTKVTDTDVERLGHTQLKLKNLLMDYKYHTSAEIAALLRDDVKDPIKEVRLLRMKGYNVITKREGKYFCYRLLSPLEEYKLKCSQSK